jgi:uncharacterized protein YcfJ
MRHHRANELGQGFQRFAAGVEARGVRKGPVLDFSQRTKRQAPSTPAFGPFQVALGRAVGQHEPARGVGAVASMISSGSTTFFFDFDIFSTRPIGRPAGRQRRRAVAVRPSARPPRATATRRLGVAVGLVADHALGEQAGEGLVQVQVAGRLHGAGEEARIEQVQDRVLDAADILVDRQPVIDASRSPVLGVAGR